MTADEARDLTKKHSQNVPGFIFDRIRNAAVRGEVSVTFSDRDLDGCRRRLEILGYRLLQLDDSIADTLVRWD